MIRLLPNLRLKLNLRLTHYGPPFVLVFMESLNPVYYRKGSSKGEKSFRAVWGLQYPVCCGDTISAVSTKVHTLWSRGFNRYAHAVASANPQVHMNYTHFSSHFTGKSVPINLNSSLYYTFYIYILVICRRFYPKRLTIGEYIKRFSLRGKQTQEVLVTPNFRHCSNKYKLERE